MLFNLFLATFLTSATCLCTNTHNRALNVLKNDSETETITTTIGGTPTNTKYTDNDTYCAYKETLEDNSIYNYLNYYNYTNFTTTQSGSSSSIVNKFEQITYMQLSYYRGVSSANNVITYEIGYFGPSNLDSTAYQDLSTAWLYDPQAYLIVDDDGQSNYINNTSEFKAQPLNTDWYDCETYVNDTYLLENATTQTQTTNTDNTYYTNVITIVLPEMDTGNYGLFIKWNMTFSESTISLYALDYTMQTTNVTLTSNLIANTISYEVIDIPGLMLYILSMPWTFISQAFNVTLFPNTPYQVNIANLFKGVLAIMSVLFIIKLLTHGFDALGNYVGGHQERSERIKTSRQKRELRAKEDARRERQQTNRDNNAKKE